MIGKHFELKSKAVLPLKTSVDDVKQRKKKQKIISSKQKIAKQKTAKDVKIS